MKISAKIFAIHSIILLLICVSVFYNSLENDWAFDDHLAIVNNKDVRDDVNFVNLWRDDIWGKSLLAVDSHRSYRPLLVVVFKLLKMGFNLEPKAFRIFSIICHCFASVFVYYAGCHIINEQMLSFGSALLFAAHPVHVEGVVAVVNLAEPLCSVFVLAAYMLFWHSSYNCVQVGTNKFSFSLISVIYTVIAAFLCFLCITVAVLLKETAITVCGIIVGTCVIEVVYKSFFNITVIAQHPLNLLIMNVFWSVFALFVVILYMILRVLIVVFDPVSLWCTLKNEVLLMLGKQINKQCTIVTRKRIFAACVSYLAPDFLKSVLLDKKDLMTGDSVYLGSSELVRRAENAYAFLDGPLMERVLSYMYLHFRYFYQLLWPVRMVAEYSYDCIPKVSSFSDPRAYLGVIVYGGVVTVILIGIIWLFFDNRAVECKKSVQKEEPLSVVEDNMPVIKEVSISTDDKLPDHFERESVAEVKVCVENLNIAEVKETEEKEVERQWRVNNISMLVSIMWLIIPFLPASGVFLRLGTLLAERLLYIPSVGYCWLVSIALYAIISVWSELLSFFLLVVSGVRNNSVVYKTGKIFYFVCIFACTVWFSMLTVQRNPAWKNDGTLHIDTVEACPRSAKSNLQVAKLRLQEGNVTGARRHVNIAREIDPNFCDVDYQDALLKVLHENDMKTGLEIAARNLQCIYSNSASMELLQKVWEQQLLAHPGDPFILEYIADTLVIPGLYAGAGQKLLAAMESALNRKNYEKALSLSVKAEKLLPNIMNSTEITGFKEKQVVTDTECGIYGLSALIRLNMLQSLAGSKRMSALADSELPRYKLFLFKTIHPNCVVVDEEKKLIVSNRAMQLVEQLDEVVTKEYGSKFNENDPSEKEPFASLYYAMYSELLSKSIDKMDKYSSKHNAQGQYHKMIAAQMISQAAKLYHKAAVAFIRLSDIESALYAFHRYSVVEKKFLHFPLSYYTIDAVDELNSMCIFASKKKCKLNKKYNSSVLSTEEISEVIKLKQEFSKIRDEGTKWNGIRADSGLIELITLAEEGNKSGKSDSKSKKKATRKTK